MGLSNWLFSFFRDDDLKELKQFGDIEKKENGISLTVDYSKNIDLKSMKTNKGDDVIFIDDNGKELTTNKEIWDWYANVDENKYKQKRNRYRKIDSNDLRLIYEKKPIVLAIYYYQTWDWILYRIEKIYIDSNKKDIVLKGINLESSKTKTVYNSKILDLKLYGNNWKRFDFFIDFLEQSDLIDKEILTEHKTIFDELYKGYYNIKVPQNTRISFDFGETIAKEDDIYVRTHNRAKNLRITKSFIYNGKHFVVVPYPSYELFFVNQYGKYLRDWPHSLNKPKRRIIPVVNMARVKLSNNDKTYAIGQHFIDEYLSKLPKYPKIKSTSDNAKRSFLSFKEAREFVHSVNLKRRKDWDDYCTGRNPEFGIKPVNIPTNPQKKYKEDWLGWKDWLGTN